MRNYIRQAAHNVMKSGTGEGGEGHGQDDQQDEQRDKEDHPLSLACDTHVLFSPLCCVSGGVPVKKITDYVG